MQISENLIDRLRKAQHVTVLTGAGVSAESGVATFRDALTGLWEKFDPAQLASAKGFRSNPALVWGWYEARRSSVLKAQPNPAHLAIAALARQVRKLTVVTQNVDDLHERAGSEGVLHLHGSLLEPKCFACDRPHTLLLELPLAADLEQSIEPPRCTYCGGRIRPGVVWFGEMLPEKIWQEAEQAAKTCQVMLVIGTSGMVWPAAKLPLVARDAGALVIQINPESTELDNCAEETLLGKAGEIMPELLRVAFSET